METSENQAFKQDLDQKGDFQRLFQMYLLFAEKGVRPKGQVIQKALESVYGNVDIITDNENSLSTFSAGKYIVTYEDDKQMPAQVFMSDFEPFDSDSINPMQRSQMWDCPDRDELLSGCKYKIMLSDFMASGLDYKERCSMLTSWLETALELFPACIAVWIPSSEKLLTRQQVLDNPWEDETRFLYFGLNGRFFNIQGGEDMLVDTLGLYAIGLPDVQYHFHDLDPNAVVNHAYNVAAYIFDQNAPIEDEETIDGLDDDGNIDPDIQWECQYEMALIQPEREVMDINPGKHASGGREQ